MSRRPEPESEASREAQLLVAFMMGCVITTIGFILALGWPALVTEIGRL